MKDKIYLRLKRNISILLPDGNWALHVGDMIVLKKIGIKSTTITPEFSSTIYLNEDSYLLTEIEYNTIKDIKAVFEGDTKGILEYHMVRAKYNSVDTIIYLENLPYTYSQIVKNEKDFNYLYPYRDNVTIKDIFEDVSLEYNRNRKIKKLVKKQL